MSFSQADDCRPVSEETAEGLRLLENSQSLLRTLFLGIALQYRSLDLQRCLLLREADPQLSCGHVTPSAMQSAAFLIILCVLLGFQKQTEELAQQSAEAGSCPDLTDVKLGAASILITLIRLIRLNCGPGSTSSSGSSADGLLSEDLTDNL